MEALHCATGGSLGIQHGAAQALEASSAERGPNQTAAGPQPMKEDKCGKRRIVDLLEETDSDNQVGAMGLEVVERDNLGFGNIVHGGGPLEARTGDDQNAPWWFVDDSKPIGAFGECTTVEKQIAAAPTGALMLGGSPRRVEDMWAHARACAQGRCAQQEAMTFVSKILRAGSRHALDFALPPRCAGCGVIVGDLHSFCSECWTKVSWCGDGGCRTCGLPLEATDEETCGRCLAQPPRIARTRAAVEYGDVARALVMKLKYGRKVGAAATMATFMAPLAEITPETLLIPVPLHRWRLWSRGFNQSALIAGELAARLGVGHRRDAIRRTRRTRPLKGMGAKQRQREVARAFEVADRSMVEGRHVVIVDDVLTSGSTADACAKVLLKAGAAQVDLLCFARVVRPSQLER